MLFYFLHARFQTGWQPFINLSDIAKRAPLIGVCLIAMGLSFHDYLFFYDDYAYLTYLTNWQHSERLGFLNLVHSSDVLENERFWLAMFPMWESLISDLSGVPGILLLSNYLELFLVPIAVVTSYWFFQKLKLSKSDSTVAILIQISLFCWMIGDDWPVGNWFFQSMAEDKVAAVFLFAPVFFGFVIDYLDMPDRKNSLLVFAAGLCLALTHPVILFFASVIAVCFVQRRASGWKELLAIATITGLLMLPFGVIRQISYSIQNGSLEPVQNVADSFQVFRYLNFWGDKYYGLNPGVLMFFDIEANSSVYSFFQFVRLFPAVLVLIAAIVSLKKLQNGIVYRYTFSVALLIAFATFPYTGWMLGEITDARLISRIAWFLPLGLAYVILVNTIRDSIADNSGSMSRRWGWLLVSNGRLAALIAAPLVATNLVFGIFPRVPLYFDVLRHNRELAIVGQFIDKEASGNNVALVLDYEDNQLLPGVSSKTRLISFREEKPDNGHNFYMTLDEINERIAASKTIREMNENLSQVERCSPFETYQVRYIVSPKSIASKFKNFISDCSFAFDQNFETKGYYLFEIRPSR
jgi:hypothetical protein